MPNGSSLSLPSYLKQWVSLCLEMGAASGVDGILLLAIMDRESCGGDVLKPHGPAGTGDNGNGLGLMQIDKRFHPDFAQRLMPDGSLAWQNPRENILYAARFLFGLINRLGNEDLGVCAYNGGEGMVREIIRKLGPSATETEQFVAANKATTGGDYGSAVMLRRAKYRLILNPSMESTS
jgi:soluble lytic murein transglycosylase-like protein